MQYNFCDLVDIAKLKKLMASFYQVTKISSAFVDLEGNILVEIGWQEICQKFHRKNPYTERLCRQSNHQVRQRLEEGKPYWCYQCPNGLMDAVAPVIIEGIHVANVYQGQFLFVQPDVNYFKGQAEKYGFDKDSYLAALAKVPIFSQEKLDASMQFFIEFAESIADIAMLRFKQFDQQRQALERSDEQIFMIFNSTPNVAIQAYDVCGNITFWNNASEELYGFKQVEVINRSCRESILDGEAAGNLISSLKEIERTNSLYGPVEWKLRHKNGKELYVYATLFPIRLSTGKKEFICMDIDITAQKHFAKEIERLDRLNLVGEMAAGLAHEIRNPMTTVRGYLQLLRNKPCYKEHVNQFNWMIEELDSANKIITEYLSLAKNKTVKKEKHDINQIVDALLPLLFSEANRGGKIIKWTPGIIRTLFIDNNEIRQLVINLVRNALEAVESEGIIQISTFMENDAAILQVQDNGKGIPQEIIDKIGTPFFTTKTEGTGLGLAVCFSIAARHNAKISIQSDTQGTCIFVKFFS